MLDDVIIRYKSRYFDYVACIFAIGIIYTFEIYRALLKNIEAMEVFKKSGVTIWECRNCGHVVGGLEAPENCPVCNHPQAYFEVRKAMKSLDFMAFSIIKT